MVLVECAISRLSRRLGSVRSLTDFLNDLPGVMTRKARAVVLQGDLLSNKEQADIHAIRAPSIPLLP